MRITSVGTITIEGDNISVSNYEGDGGGRPVEALKFQRKVIRTAIWALVRAYFSTPLDGGGNTGIIFKEVK